MTDSWRPLAYGYDPQNAPDGPEEYGPTTEEEWVEVIDAIDHLLGTHAEFEHLHWALKVAQAAVFHARGNGTILEII